MTPATNTTIVRQCRAIIAACAREFGADVQDVTGKTRKAHVVSARHAAAYLMYTHLPMTYEAVGLVLGSRDYSTAIHAVQSVRDIFDTRHRSAPIIAGLEREIFGEAATRTETPRESTRPSWPIQDKAPGERAAQARVEARPPVLIENDTLAQFAVDAARTARRGSLHTKKKRRRSMSVDKLFGGRDIDGVKTEETR